MSTTDRIPLILDVDTGIDDSLALLYAASSPEAEIVAMTALSGNVHVDDTERNTRAVLELAGRTDIEVAAGRPVPLLRPLEVTPETHGPHGIGYAELPEPTRPRSERFAPQLIVDEARRRPGRAHARDAGAADEPRDRACSWSRSCRACSSAGSSWAARSGRPATRRR